MPGVLPGHTICYRAGLRWVKIGSDPDPLLYKDLKIGSDTRTEAVQRAYTERYAVAHRLIFQAFPELQVMLHTNKASRIHIKDGEIELRFVVESGAKK